MKKIILFLTLLALFTSEPALATCEGEKSPTDQSLVLAIDISNSIDGEETYTQMMGYKQALLDRQVQESILGCGCTDMSVVLFGSHTHTVVKRNRIKVVQDLVTLSDFFHELGAAKTPLYLQFNDPGLTFVADGLSEAIDILNDAKNTSNHKAILISGDGKNSRNEPDRFAELRRTSVELYIQVSAIPIDVYDAYTDSDNSNSSITKSPPSADLESFSQESMQEPLSLPEFYKDHVINDLGFIKIARSYKDLPPIVIQSLREISCKPIM